MSSGRLLRVTISGNSDPDCAGLAWFRPVESRGDHAASGAQPVGQHSVAVQKPTLSQDSHGQQDHQEKPHMSKSQAKRHRKKLREGRIEA